MKAQRYTLQRQVIYEELKKLSSHPTASELYGIVQKRLPRISLGTVYRNLELLARCKLVRKIEVGGTETRFDAECRTHNHVRCIKCGRVDDLRGVPADLQEGRFIHPDGYEVLGCRMEFIGICPECRPKGKSQVNDIKN